MELLQVDCLPGFDGGLEQEFVLEVVDGLSMLHLANVSSPSPQFTVTGLNPGQEVNLIIKAVNSNGASEPVVMDVFTTKVAQLQVGEFGFNILFNIYQTNAMSVLLPESPVPLQFTPFLGILAGIVVTLIILILTVIIVIKIKYKYGKQLNTSNTSETSEADNNSDCSHYKSFKFDSDKKFLSSDCSDSYNSQSSSQSEPAVNVVAAADARLSRAGLERCGDTSLPRDKSGHNPGRRSEAKVIVSQCDPVSSWTPFLARDCEESVI